MEPVNIDEARTRLSQRVDRAVAGPPRLTDAVRRTIASADAVFVSAASIREAANRDRLGKPGADPQAMSEPLKLLAADAAPVPYSEREMLVRDTA